jgi:hypothetical protein
MVNEHKQSEVEREHAKTNDTEQTEAYFIVENSNVPLVCGFFEIGISVCYEKGNSIILL